MCQHKKCPLTNGCHDCDVELFRAMLPDPNHCTMRINGVERCAPRCNGLVLRWAGFAIRNSCVAPRAHVAIPLELIRASVRAQFYKDKE